MSRLTNKELAEKYRNGYYGDICKYEEIYVKLCDLEDIMEKYGIESIEELDETLEDNIYSKEAFNKLLSEAQDLHKDRDIWKKACMLACELLKEDGLFDDTIEQITNHFYIRAQKENKQ